MVLNIAIPCGIYYGVKKLLYSASDTPLKRLYTSNPLLWICTCCASVVGQRKAYDIASSSLQRFLEREADGFAIATADHATELYAAALLYSSKIDTASPWPSWIATHPSHQERAETMLNAAYIKAHQDYFEGRTIDTAEYNELVGMIAQQWADLQSNNTIAS